MWDIRARWKETSRLIRLRVMALGALAIMAVAPSLIALVRTETIDGFLLNFGTEMAGAFVTFIVFDQLIGHYEKHEEEVSKQEKLKAELSSQLGSRVQDVAVNAAEQLRRLGWLMDGTLRDSFLPEANLQGARLTNADLRGANLTQGQFQGADLGNTDLQGARLGDANFQRAYLFYANLQEAFLWQANLQGAHLQGANLQRAMMWEADCQEVILLNADLQGVNLQYANLQGADLRATRFNEETILPDSTTWVPETDMTRFTNPSHPKFWRPVAPFLPWWYLKGGNK